MRRKMFIVVPAVAIGLAMTLLAVAFVAYPSEYVFRVLRSRGVRADDYKRFPARSFAASETRLRFTQSERSMASALTLAVHQPAFDDFLERTGTQAFIVLKDSSIYERYLQGNTRESLVTSFSIAKSFLSTLVGIAIGQGLIHSVDDPVTRYLPELELRDKRFAKIRIHDLLTMTSGIKYKEFPLLNGDDVKTYFFPDLRKLALSQTVVEEEPGRRFLYNNYNALLLGIVLERATGKSVTTYLSDVLWQPMGAEYGGSWSLDSRNGLEKLESGLNARAIDFAKLGYLFLNKGMVRGKRAVPEEWIAAAIRGIRSQEVSSSAFGKQICSARRTCDYGLMWWVFNEGRNDRSFLAWGNLGQFLFVSPAEKMVIVRFGERYGVTPARWMDLFESVAAGREVELSP
jgi:CubicO group peptidase (beta-lactamase class C family)